MLQADSHQFSAIQPQKSSRWPGQYMMFLGETAEPGRSLYKLMHVLMGQRSKAQSSLFLLLLLFLNNVNCLAHLLAFFSYNCTCVSAGDKSEDFARMRREAISTMTLVAKLGQWTYLRFSGAFMVPFSWRAGVYLFISTFLCVVVHS
ncbi:hypothetical protein BT63DRAFT_86992 [Microthyrium microscopicum]|uniref:Uncharacterized protein n=1 Tax=Microthyrium microscopicum TaxID=703497 RepID=A0A6A6U1N2_9PEZI|nr:hypothetical protein BT63DRAFT_86992 [Microthyrium microscopicum]